LTRAPAEARELPGISQLVVHDRTHFQADTAVRIHQAQINHHPEILTSDGDIDPVAMIRSSLPANLGHRKGERSIVVKRLEIGFLIGWEHEKTLRYWLEPVDRGDRFLVGG
jgi:hypothetical protein